VKVFKPKGADRKHKTDREKMGKRPQPEQDKFQPSYDCTVFTEYPLDSLYWSSSLASSPSASSISVSSPSVSGVKEQRPRSNAYPENESLPQTPKSSIPRTVEKPPVEQVVSAPTAPTFTCSVLPSEADDSETSLWLQRNRFDGYVTMFSNFSGADILRLTRDDLIQICGLADGIRLYNALHSRTIRPRLTLYVCSPADEVFRAIYLENLTLRELASKLKSLMLETTDCNSIRRIFTCGPSGIRVLISDEVVQNMAEESMFTVEFDKESSCESTFKAILKPYK